jgi:hypothetical protein
MSSSRLQRTIIVIALLGGMIALFGTYWDDAWHTDLGRDEFASPPHLVLYGGVTLIGFTVALWAGQAVLKRRTLRALFTEAPLLLAGVGVVATLLSAPIDDFWHSAFGRDAVLWSPPHMAGVAALFAVSVALLLKSKRVFGSNSFWTTLAAALLMGVSLIPVMEYETDVPQFAMVWYLPAQILGSMLAFIIIGIITHVKWAIAKGALVYTLLRIIIYFVLLASGYSLPVITPILLSAIAFDLLLQSQLPLVVRAILFTAVTYLVYSLYLGLLYAGFEQRLEALIVGFALSVALVAVALAIEARLITRHLSIVVALIMVCVIALPTEAVLAHDPGQGEEVASVYLSASSSGLELQVTAEISAAACDNFTPLAIVARRAGDTLRADLRLRDHCTYEGAINVTSQGRWFVYTEFQTESDTVEAWLPVIVEEQTVTFQKSATLYKPLQRSESVTQLVSGIILYAANFFLIGFAFYAVRKEILAISTESA